jgi:hypothetical protein
LGDSSTPIYGKKLLSNFYLVRVFLAEFDKNSARGVINLENLGCAQQNPNKHLTQLPHFHFFGARKATEMLGFVGAVLNCGAKSPQNSVD